MQTLDIYARNLHNALQDLLTRTREHQATVGFRRASGSGASFTPASTSEEIAMTAIELASRARTIEEMISVATQTYKDLFKMEKQND